MKQDCDRIQRTALVVDDDPDTVRLIGLILSESGFQVIAAYDGGEGLEYMACMRPDVIVLDLQMPVLDGWQFLERMPGSGGTPIMVLTERNDAASEARCRALGVADYLVKPVNARDLVERMARALSML